MTLPTLNPLWRSDSINDRELIRIYSGAPATGVNMAALTNAMNLMAEASPAAVASCQKAIDEIEDLEATWADRVSAGTSVLSAAQEYDGPIPGVTLTQEDRMRRADVVEWDSSLLRVKYSTGGGASTEGSHMAARVEALKQQVLTAIGFQGYSSAGRVIRS